MAARAGVDCVKRVKHLTSNVKGGVIGERERVGGVVGGDVVKVLVLLLLF